MEKRESGAERHELVLEARDNEKCSEMEICESGAERGARVCAARELGAGKWNCVIVERNGTGKLSRLCGTGSEMEMCDCGAEWRAQLPCGRPKFPSGALMRDVLRDEIPSMALMRDVLRDEIPSMAKVT